MRNCLLLTSCLLLAALGCTDERADRIDKQQQQIRTLQGQNDSLQRQSKALRDSLGTLAWRVRDLEDELRAQKKLHSLLLDNRVGVWEPNEQATRIRFADSVDAQSVHDLVAAFNERFAGSFNPRLQLQSVKGAVARVEVSDDGQLGERMGTTGSEMYVATMTYTLTSYCHIDRVYLDIDEGSHAGPGYYSRATWINLVQEE